MRKVTSIVDFSYRGTMDGQVYEGTAQSTEYWVLTNGPVDKGVLLKMHKDNWIQRMKADQNVTVHPSTVRVLNTQFLT